MPSITWIGSPNFYPSRYGYNIIAIVNHIMCGTLAGTDAWFKDPSSKVSAHYGVGKDGSIHQYVRDEHAAWAVGLVNNPTWPLYTKTGGHPNLCTISIEHEGYPEDGLTEAQYQATLWLHKKLIQDHGIVVDRNHIIGHDQLDTVNRKDCPGPKFPWDRLFADLKGVVGVLQLGASGDEVKQLQTNLNRILGVHLTVDGQFGAATAAAVKSFQQITHLQVDGIAGPQTLAAIDAKIKALDAAKPQPTPTPAAPAPAQPSHADKVNQVNALLQQAMDLVKTL